MTADKLPTRQAPDGRWSRSIPAVCVKLGGIPSSTLYNFVHADGSLKQPGLALLEV